MANTNDETDMNESASTSESRTGILSDDDEPFTIKAMLFPQNSDPTKLSGAIVNASASIVGLLIITFCCLAVLGKDALAEGSAAVTCLLVVVFVLCLIVTIIIWRQPESKTKLSFKVPFLPVLPILSIFVNVYLMMQLDTGTWIRFAIWMVIGFLIYFGYGVRNSTEAAAYAASSNADRNDNGYKRTPNQNADGAAPEKEAFLDNADESSPVNPWSTEEA